MVRIDNTLYFHSLHLLLQHQTLLSYPRPIHTLDQESQVIFSAYLKPSNIHITTAVRSQLFSNPEEGSKTRAETSEEIKNLEIVLESVRIVINNNNDNNNNLTDIFPLGI